MDTATTITLVPPYDQNQTDSFFSSLLIDTAQIVNVIDRVELFSRKLLRSPYILGALGEGPNGKFDQNPLYRHDAFDCVTFVSTVLALSRASTLEAFTENIQNINYKNRNIEYIYRNHFMSVDWNPKNEKLGLFKNITKQFVDAENNVLCKFASALINRPNWIKHRELKDIKLLTMVDAIEAQYLLKSLHDQASLVHLENSTMDYIALTDLFDSNRKPVFDIFNQIPHGSIVEIVRPNWNLQDKIGTNLHISHLGFVFRNADEIIFCHASESQNQVVEEKLTEYLFKHLDSPTIKGIHVLQINENN